MALLNVSGSEEKGKKGKKKGEGGRGGKTEGEKWSHRSLGHAALVVSQARPNSAKRERSGELCIPTMSYQNEISWMT